MHAIPFPTSPADLNYSGFEAPVLPELFQSDEAALLLDRSFLHFEQCATAAQVQQTHLDNLEVPAAPLTKPATMVEHREPLERTTVEAERMGPLPDPALAANCATVGIHHRISPRGHAGMQCGLAPQ
jgi:hypothetical protein